MIKWIPRNIFKIAWERMNKWMNEGKDEWINEYLQDSLGKDKRINEWQDYWMNEYLGISSG